MDAAKRTKEQSYSYPSNSCTPIQYDFKVQVAHRLIASSVLSQLNELLEKTVEEELMRNIVETLPNSDASMWYLDRGNQHLKEICVFLCTEYSIILESGSVNRNKAVRDDTIQAFNELVAKTRVLSLVSYLKCETNITQEAVKHQYVDTVFCTAQLYIQENTH